MVRPQILTYPAEWKSSENDIPSGHNICMVPIITYFADIVSTLRLFRYFGQSELLLNPELEHVLFSRINLQLIRIWTLCFQCRYYALLLYDVYKINACRRDRVCPSIHVFHLESRWTDFDVFWYREPYKKFILYLDFYKFHIIEVGLYFFIMNEFFIMKAYLYIDLYSEKVSDESSLFS